MVATYRGHGYGVFEYLQKFTFTRAQHELVHRERRQDLQGRLPRLREERVAADGEARGDRLQRQRARARQAGRADAGHAGLDAAAGELHDAAARGNHSGGEVTACAAGGFSATLALLLSATPALADESISNKLSGYESEAQVARHGPADAEPLVAPARRRLTEAEVAFELGDYDDRRERAVRSREPARAPTARPPRTTSARRSTRRAIAARRTATSRRSRRSRRASTTSRRWCGLSRSSIAQQDMAAANDALAKLAARRFGVGAAAVRARQVRVRDAAVRRSDQRVRERAARLGLRAAGALLHGRVAGREEGPREGDRYVHRSDRPQAAHERAIAASSSSVSSRSAASTTSATSRRSRSTRTC